MSLQHKHSHLTELVIRAFYSVYNSLGYGFLEILISVYLRLSASHTFSRAALACAAPLIALPCGE